MADSFTMWLEAGKMKIRRLYFEMFADAVEAASNNKDAVFGHKEQRAYTLLILSLAQGLNLALVLIIFISISKVKLSLLSIDIFPGTYLDGALSGIIMLVLPFLALNYFLLLRRKSYLNYTVNRKIRTKGRALLFYFVGSFLALILTVIIGKVIS